MPTNKRTKKSTTHTTRKAKKKPASEERDEVIIEETTRVERAPVLGRRKPATLARALAEDVVVETTEPEIEKTVVRKHRRKLA